GQRGISAKRLGVCAVRCARDPLESHSSTLHYPPMRRWLPMLLLPVLCLVGCHTICEQPPRKWPSYPAYWWTPVPKEGAPAWEILPQEAKPGEVILSKRNELGLLSNFAATPFDFRGKRYASLEGFWQMMKYPEGPKDPRVTFPGL